MTKIHTLDMQTANSIAAGEVVERPASIVKELVENALDAAATVIHIAIEQGGIRLIRVTDNGCGMDREDARLAFGRHATSKLKQIDDLDQLATMGFRGEALASIAAVAKVRLETREPGSDEGYFVQIEGGALIDEGPVGCAEGTSMKVEHLFYNMPARFKFLKKDTTEANVITDMIMRLALARADVSFRLTNNRQEVLHTPGNADLTSTLYALFGRQTANACVNVSVSQPPVRVTGLAGRPELARANRNQQFFFVNGRVIRSRALTAAVDEAYRTLLMKGRFAFTVLFIDVPPQLVDVNVHPQKLEVRFWQDQDVFRAVYHGVRQALMDQAGLLQDLKQPADKDEHEKKTDNQDAGASQNTTQTDADRQAADGQLMNQSGQHQPNQYTKNDPEQLMLGDQPRQTSLTEQPSSANQHQHQHQNGSSAESNHPAMSSGKTTENKVTVDKTYRDKTTDDKADGNKTTDDKAYDDSAHEANSVTVDQHGKTENQAVSQKPDVSVVTIHELARARLIGQLFQTYLLFELDDDMLLLDQHAAHEKVLFEKLVEKKRERRKHQQATATAQHLLVPLTLAVSSREMQLIEQQSEKLETLGFTFEPFGNQAVLLRSLPDGNLNQLNGEAAFRLALDALMQDDMQSDDAIDELYYTMACKAAVKAHDRLKPEEIKQLLMDLQQLENPYQCPHGRPVLIRLSRYELEKKFKRIV